MTGRLVPGLGTAHNIKISRLGVTSPSPEELSVYGLCETGSPSNVLLLKNRNSLLSSTFFVVGIRRIIVNQDMVGKNCPYCSPPGPFKRTFSDLYKATLGRSDQDLEKVASRLYNEAWKGPE